MGCLLSQLSRKDFFIFVSSIRTQNRASAWEWGSVGRNMLERSVTIRTKDSPFFFTLHSGLGRDVVHEKSLTDGLSIRLGGEYRNRTDDLLHAMQAL